MATTKKTPSYPVRLHIDYPEKLNRLTTFLRILWIIPIFVIQALVDGSMLSDNGINIVFGLAFALVLMILFRQKYPRWWFDFLVELMRFTGRVFSYLFLLTDTYPSTDEKQSFHLDIDYPDAGTDLNRFLPLVKWILLLPHYIVMMFLLLGLIVAVLVAWVCILFTGSYPRIFFDYVVGVMRWAARMQGYALMMVTDRYPPFSLE